MLGRNHLLGLLAVASLVGVAAALVFDTRERGTESIADDSFDDRVASLIDSAPAEQADLFEDGEVTSVEYRTAVDRVLACLDRHEVWYSEPTLDTSRYWPRWSFTTVVVTNPETGVSYYDECDATYLREVELVWSGQHRPSAQEIADVYDGIVACAQDAGSETTTAAEVTEEMLALDFANPLRGELSDCFANAKSGHGAPTGND